MPARSLYLTLATAVATSAVVAVTTSSPAHAATPAWHAEDLPSTLSASADGHDPRTVALSDAGELVLSIHTSGSSTTRWAARPVGGPLGAPAAFPSGSALGTQQPTYAMDAAGDTLSWALGAITYRPAGGTFGTPQITSGAPVVDLAVAPSGDALGLFKAGPTGLEIAYRAAGASSTFDLTNATALSPAVGDDTVTGLGIALDADGGAIVTYVSTKTGVPSVRNILQATRTAGQPSFGAASQITWPAGYGGPTFGRAADGTAVLYGVGNSNRTEMVSVRAPGAAFAAPTAAFDEPSGSDIGVGVSIFVVAMSGGHAAVGISRTDDAATHCSDYSDVPVEAEVNAYDGSTWKSYYRGPGSGTARSKVLGLAAAGAHLVAVTEEITNTTPDCSATHHTYTRAATVRSGTLNDATPFASTHGLSSFTHTDGDPGTTDVGVGALAASSTGGIAVDVFTSASTVVPDTLSVLEDPSATPPAPSPSPSSSAPTTVAGSTAPSSAAPTSGSPTTSANPFKPVGIVIKGPVVVRHFAVPVPLQCPPEEPGTCLIAIQLLGVKAPAASAHTKAKTKVKTVVLGTASTTLAPGRKATVTIKLSKAGKAALKGRKTAKATLSVTTRIGAAKVTTRKAITLKLS